MFSGWGLRTLSTEAVNYKPLSYHNGSVWPHDTSLAIAGLGRYGCGKEAQVLARGLFEAGLAFPDRRLPELFSGSGRVAGEPPGEYPVSCSPQAWAAASPFLVLQSLCGLQVDATKNVIRFEPIPTSLVRTIRVEGMWAGTGEIDFTVESDGETSRVEVDRNNTDLVVEARS
jgi:glycogen debranching enzyme